MSFAAVGIAVVLPGALLPVLIERLGLRLSDAGLLLAAQPFGHLCSVLLLPYAVSRLDSRGPLVVAGSLLSAAVAALGWVSGWHGALLAMAISGASIGALEVGTNTVLLVHTPEPNRILNLTHLFFGVTSVLTPALAALGVEAGVRWEWVWALASVPILAMALCWAAFAPSLAGTRPKPLTEQPRTNVLGQWPKLALVVAMGAYVGAEIGFGSWYTKYLAVAHDVPLASAGRGLSLYWAGLTLGRLLLARWAPGQSGVPFVTALGIGAAFVGAGALMAPGAMTFMLLGTLLGVSLAGIFPGLLALAARWYPTQVARVTGALLSGAGLGQMLFPWAMATVAEEVGVPRAMWIYPGLCFLVSVSVLWGSRRQRRRSVKAEAPF